MWFSAHPNKQAAHQPPAGVVPPPPSVRTEHSTLVQTKSQELHTPVHRLQSKVAGWTTSPLWTRDSLKPVLPHILTVAGKQTAGELAGGVRGREGGGSPHLEPAEPVSDGIHIRNHMRDNVALTSSAVAVRAIDRLQCFFETIFFERLSKKHRGCRGCGGGQRDHGVGLFWWDGEPPVEGRGVVAQPWMAIVVLRTS